MDIRIYKDILIVYLEGDIDQHKVSNIKKEIDKMILKQNAKNIIFEFSNVSFMDSSGIGMVLSRYKELLNNNGKVALACVSKNTMKLFDMVGIQKIIDIYNTIDEALLNF